VADRAYLDSLPGVEFMFDRIRELAAVHQAVGTRTFGYNISPEM